MKVENGLYSKISNTTTEEKRSSDERHHMYISEVELEMHKRQISLWAKPEIYFQSFVADEVKIGDIYAFGGETEIEEVPTHLVEARSKDLVPVLISFKLPRPNQGGYLLTVTIANSHFLGWRSPITAILWLMVLMNCIIP